MAGETTVGGILGFLRLDASQFHREIQSAILEAEALGETDVNVKVKTEALDRLPRSAKAASTSLDGVTSSSRRLEDATSRVNVATLKLNELNDSGKAKASQIATAHAALARALREEQDAIFATYHGNVNLAHAQDEVAVSGGKVEESNKRIAKSARDGSNGMGALGTAIIAIGPAIVPLAAGAVGLGAAFGGMGTAGILAVVGVKNEMKAGTAVGLTYKASVDQLKSSFNGLAKVAATNTLSAFQAAVADLQARTPQLTRAIGGFSTMVGTTAANLTGGLLSAFLALEPLMRDAGGYILTLSTRFAAAMTGPGIVSFGDYVRSVFPLVMQALESIVTAAGHLVAAFAPLGMGVLATLRVLSDLISAIPVDVLSVVATTAVSVFVGFRTWQGLSGLVSGLGGALVKLGATAAATATTMTVLNVAAGGIGIAIAALSFIMSANAESQRQAEQAANDYADALRASNGVVDDSIRALAAKRLADSGALDMARQLGVSQATVTDVALGTAGAQGLLKAQVDAAREAMRAQVAQQGASGAGYDEFNGKVAALEKQLGLEHGALEEGVQKNKDLAAATETTAGATDAAAVAAKNLAAAYGVSVPSYLAAAEGAKQHAQQAANATAQMQYENDAAGLLKQGLDLLNGKNLDLATAQTNAASATLSLTTSLKDNGTSLSLNTAKGVANRQALERKVAADQAAAVAQAKATGATDGGTAALRKSKTALENTLRAQGKLTPAVQAYIDKIYKVPKVAPTRMEVEKKNAEAALAHIRSILNNLAKGVYVPVNVHYTSTGRLPNGGMNTHGGQDAGNGGSGGTRPKGKGATGGLIQNGIRHFSGGGLLTGPGTGTSDSILAQIQDSGELIRVANQEFISTAASQRRNRAALEAGNKGATLTVAGQDGSPVELGAATIAAIAAAVARVQVRATVRAGQFDSALAVSL